MNANSVSQILQKTAETHHIVYQDVDGADPDWAIWYATWIWNHTNLNTHLRVSLSMLSCSVTKSSESDQKQRIGKYIMRSDWCKNIAEH